MFAVIRLFLLALVLQTPFLAALHADEVPGGIRVSDPWARASVTASGAAYFTIENSGNEDDILVAVRSDAAETVEMHTMTMDGMVMKMRKLSELPVKAGETVKFAPGGLHIMLIRLKEPLREGMSVSMTLTFEKAGEVHVTAPVQAAGHGAH
ncbi:protein of unknown function DUF461 [Parvibaculum lavamentivorans DS-1]|uniref:Copper chaperone PCu(A)C n=1 Tax=Parvibaculum lavamentivorans (strain DS-1 / DSM 13023 / NCIMB 13966) TaxID=402881 RepID=A7HSU7_PARL1|nr:copper chaperone PCu(A)C [Parvibaculum lavamentivorans]ABS62980.1 protein of unknown function DUF461 [Parvibaculum lavamentivorans DS-1]